MPTQTRVVRLLQNHIYPTYQLYAAMSNKQTIPADGLRLAALQQADHPSGWSAFSRSHHHGVAAAADGGERSIRADPAGAQPIQGGRRRLSAIAAHQPGICDRYCIPTTGGGVEPANHRTGSGIGARKPKPAAAGRAGSDH